MKTLRVAAVAAWVCVLALALAGCKPGVPSTFIQEDDMEDLLYDYHLADAMARDAKGDYNENIMAYRAAVLRKYGVSQAEFDTSMVYYMRHTDRLHAIYEHVAQCMQDDARGLGSSSDDLAALATTSATGDTADIWRGERSIALIPNQPYNVYSFAHTADSSFRRGDAFILSLQSDFIFQDGPGRGLRQRQRGLARRAYLRGRSLDTHARQPRQPGREGRAGLLPAQQGQPGQRLRHHAPPHGTKPHPPLPLPPQAQGRSRHAAGSGRGAARRHHAPPRRLRAPAAARAHRRTATPATHAITPLNPSTHIA